MRGAGDSFLSRPLRPSLLTLVEALVSPLAADNGLYVGSERTNLQVTGWKALSIQKPAGGHLRDYWGRA